MRYLIATFLVLWTFSAAGAAEPLLTLKDGDRILFLGGGYVENDQEHAFLETRLQRRFPKTALTFRYMGWSGDTVRGGARTAGYEVPDGLARLEKEVFALKPTVLFLAYGMNESFDGVDALPAFLADYGRLLKTLAPLQARLVIVSPTYHEDLGRPYPDPADHNKQLEGYTRALKDLSAERKLLFVDLFHPLEESKKANPKLRLTTNGVLLTTDGYAQAAKASEEQLGFAAVPWEVDWKVKTPIKAAGAKVVLVDFLMQGAINDVSIWFQFNVHDALLPSPDGLEPRTLRITNSRASDKLHLKIDGQKVLSASVADWRKGVNIAKGPVLADAEKLRAAIVERNQLFYRRWRPYNDHSRHWGFIGGDGKLYDREIGKLEERIAGLRSPRPRVYEISSSDR
jgi:lysophospholipase L1-like esterase